VGPKGVHLAVPAQYIPILVAVRLLDGVGSAETKLGRVQIELQVPAVDRSRTLRVRA
jgi:hypothetical protein